MSSNYNHKELANDFGKLSAASLSFLLLPLSKYSNLLSTSLGGSEVHIVKMHIYAGYIALVGGILHGLYYIWIWIEVDGYTSLDDVFPLLYTVSSGSSSNIGDGSSNSNRNMHQGHDHDASHEASSSTCYVKDYNKQCHIKFVNLTGIINGISFILLSITSLWYIRRHYYLLFYVAHIVLSTMLLFTLVLHYNKMIWYIGPSILCYIGCNVPVYIEGLYKSLGVGGGGGVCVSKVCCIPESRGCVELTIVRNNDDSGSSGGGDDSDDDFIGKYVRLTVPEISSKSHPFTAFCDPNHHQQQRHLKILFRPIGKFTTQLSKRLELLVTSPEMTPSEYTLHSNRTDATAATTTTTRRPPRCLSMVCLLHRI